MRRTALEDSIATNSNKEGNHILNIGSEAKLASTVGISLKPPKHVPQQMGS
jgi:hypothetical protein